MTLRELAPIALARSEHAWNHTSQILAMVANSYSRRHRSPSEFHPFRTVERDSIASAVRGIAAMDMSIFKPVSLTVTPPPPKDHTHEQPNVPPVGASRTSPDRRL